MSNNDATSLNDEMTKIASERHDAATTASLNEIFDKMATFLPREQQHSQKSLDATSSSYFSNKSENNGQSEASGLMENRNLNVNFTYIIIIIFLICKLL